MQNGNEELENNPTRNIVVLYEDTDCVVIDKPVGVIVHNDGRTTEPTVVDWFLARAPLARGVGETGFTQEGIPLERSGVVHRLDRDTSGVLILAKTQEAFGYLKSQFHDHHVRKEYRAFVYGHMREKWGTVDRAIGRSAKDFRLRSAQRGARGTIREAVTDWELIEQSDKHAYLKMFPKTGRTHQIRVHLKAIGRPIVGDMLYAPEELLRGDSLGFTRLALHAHTMRITLPKAGEQTFCALIPADFERARNSIATV